METIDEMIARAFDRGAKAAAAEPRAVAVRLDTERQRLVLDLEGGAELSIPISALGLPPNADLSDVRVEGGGFDLYFPAIDEGAFVPDLASSDPDGVALG